MSILNCRLNRYRRGLETCPQAKTFKSERSATTLFSSFFSTRPSDVYNSAPSRILASTFGRFRLYRLNNWKLQSFVKVKSSGNFNAMGIKGLQSKYLILPFDKWILGQFLRCPRGSYRKTLVHNNLQGNFFGPFLYLCFYAFHAFHKLQKVRHWVLTISSWNQLKKQVRINILFEIDRVIINF